MSPGVGGWETKTTLDLRRPSLKSALPPKGPTEASARWSRCLCKRACLAVSSDHSRSNLARSSIRASRDTKACISARASEPRVIADEHTTCTVRGIDATDTATQVSHLTCFTSCTILLLRARPDVTYTRSHQPSRTAMSHIALTGLPSPLSLRRSHLAGVRSK